MSGTVTLGAGISNLLARPPENSADFSADYCAICLTVNPKILSNQNLHTKKKHKMMLLDPYSLMLDQRSAGADSSGVALPTIPSGGGTILQPLAFVGRHQQFAVGEVRVAEAGPTGDTTSFDASLIVITQLQRASAIMVKIIHAQVSPIATVLQMKQKIHSKKDIPIHDMQLWYNNQQLQDDKPLSHYAITNRTYLTLKIFKRSGNCPCADCMRMEEKITMNVTSLSKTIKVSCTLGEPVENLKKSIKKIEGTPVSRQKLVFKNQELEDHKLLASYKFVDEEAGVNLDPEVQLFVDNGNPTLLERLSSMVSFRGTKTPATTTPTTTTYPSGKFSTQTTTT